jgi:hypothetical protein
MKTDPTRAATRDVPNSAATTARALVALAALALAVTGCAPSRTYVLSAPAGGTASPTAVTGYSLRAMTPSVRTEAGLDDRLAAALAEKLKARFGAAPVETGDLIIEHRFVLFEGGNPVLRVGSTLTNLAGSPIYGLGDGAVGVEVRFRRADGAELGHIVTDGSIAGAFGSTSAALDEAAGSIATFAGMNFVCPTCGELGVKRAEPADVRGLRRQQ